MYNLYYIINLILNYFHAILHLKKAKMSNSQKVKILLSWVQYLALICKYLALIS